MALISCSECRREISDKAAACPNCGAPVGSAAPITNRWAEPPVQKKSSIWKWVLGVPIGGFVLMMIIGSCSGNTPEGESRAASRSAIKACWNEQGRKSLDPAMGRLVASACEKMERDFRDKWGVSP